MGRTNPPPVKSICSGRNHNLALFTDGNIVAWGDNSFNQCSVPVNLSNVVAITAGFLHSAALLSNGTVVIWGDNSFGQANIPPGVTTVVSIAAGDFHTFALRSDGTVIGWGDNTYGQLTFPANLANVSAISSGNYHGLALTRPARSLQSSLLSSKLVLHWTGSGILQCAPTPAGPYADVGCQGNSYTNVDMATPAKFFRLR